MSCSCVADLNDKLAPDHEVMSALFFDGRPPIPLISLVRRDTYTIETRKGRPKSVAPNFCPWCGAVYPASKSQDEAFKSVEIA